MIPIQTAKIIELIKQGKTCNQISNEMNLTNQQLYRRLTNIENKGLFFKRKYYSDGNILYRPISSITILKDYKKSQSREIITRPDESEMKIVVISDIHLGSKFERLDLLDRVYNYCIKNNINIIFNCGDLIDGTYSQTERKIKDVYSQIEYLIKNYPFDRNIINFAVGGDHDFSALNTACQDITEIINNYRHDIVMPSYNNTVINIKNDKILLHHHHQQGKSFQFTEVFPLVLNGHVHRYQINEVDSKGTISLTVPSLSDVNESIPTAIELNLTFKTGYISNVTFKQIQFGDKDYIISEANYKLSNRIMTPYPIMYQEPYAFNSMQVNETIQEEQESMDDNQKNIENTGITEETTETVIEKESILVKKLERTSQIDKFNKRYNL